MSTGSKAVLARPFGRKTMATGRPCSRYRSLYQRVTGKVGPSRDLRPWCSLTMWTVQSLRLYNSVCATELDSVTVKQIPRGEPGRTGGSHLPACRRGPGLGGRGRLHVIPTSLMTVPMHCTCVCAGRGEGQLWTSVQGGSMTLLHHPCIGKHTPLALYARSRR